MNLRELNNWEFWGLLADRTGNEAPSGEPSFEELMAEQELRLATASDHLGGREGLERLHIAFLMGRESAFRKLANLMGKACD